MRRVDRFYISLHIVSLASRDTHALKIKLPMFTAARRGPASVARVVRLSSSTPRWNPSSLPQSKFYFARNGNSCIAARPLSYTTPFRQHAAARALEPEIEQETNAQQPPSDQQIKEAIPHGPVTKFQGLSDRKMVCDTLVKTITKDMGLETMTQVQSMTINETLKGIDV